MGPVRSSRRARREPPEQETAEVSSAAAGDASAPATEEAATQPAAEPVPEDAQALVETERVSTRDEVVVEVEVEPETGKNQEQGFSAGVTPMDAELQLLSPDSKVWASRALHRACNRMALHAILT